MLHLYINIHTRRHFETGQGVDRLLGRGDDVDQTLMCALLELFARVFVFVDCAQDGDDLLFGRKRNRSADDSAGLLDRIDDLVRDGVKRIERAIDGTDAVQLATLTAHVRHIMEEYPEYSIISVLS